MKPRRISTAIKSEAFLRISPRYSNILFVQSRNLCFFPIPKNANSYLKALLLHNDRDGASAFDPRKTSALNFLRSTEERFKPDSWRQLHGDNIVKFAVLRNPYSRLVSWFVDKLVKPVLAADNQPPQTFDERAGIPNVGCFRDLVTIICSTPDFRRDRHVRSQAHFLYRFSGVRLDHLGTVEHLEGTLTFLKGLGLSDLPEALFSGVGKRTAYGDRPADGQKHAADFTGADFLAHGIPPAVRFADAALEELVQRTYREDYELWHAALKGNPTASAKPLQK
jgi:hypothetical protein